MGKLEDREYHKKLRVERLKQNLCTFCGGLRDKPELKTCKICREGDKRNKDKRRSQGLCSTCGIQPSREGKSQCERCSINSRVQKLGLDRQQWIFVKEAWFSFTGVCASCGATDPGSSHDWAIDHDHKTMKFRGFLCHPCNLVLGHVSDNTDTLKKLVAYLENYDARVKDGDRHYQKTTRTWINPAIGGQLQAV